MIKNIIIRITSLVLILFLFCSTSYAQFRMVGIGNWTSSGNNYSASVTFSSDVTGNNYVASQIQPGFRVIDEFQRTYNVVSTSSAIFLQATILISPLTLSNSEDSVTVAPEGQVMIFDPYNDTEAIPQVPFGSAGATSRIQAAIDTWNSRLTGIFSDVPDSLTINGPILRVATVGATLPTTTPIDWITWHYFTPPTMSLSQSPGTSVFEVGDSVTITLTSTTTNPAGATLSNGQIQVGNAQVSGFFANTTGSFSYDFTPQQNVTGAYNQFIYSFSSKQDWSGVGETGTATSNTRTVRAVYPVFYGMVIDTATAFADIYSEMNKLVQVEGNKTVSFTGTGLIFYCMPDTWANTNLSAIIDPNGFNVTPSFTRVTYPTVTSTGLTNNYTDVGCVCYFLNTGQTTTNNSPYTFNR